MTIDYSKMTYKAAGNTGLQLPQLAYGLWHNFGDDADYAQMTKLLTTALDTGITYFDLANNYGPKPGAAERHFGEILKGEFANHRDELLISTKAGYEMWDGPYGNWGSRKHLMASLDQSLRRLQLDYVDIFYHHRMDPNTPLEETMQTLADIVHQGKALYVGLSNYDGPTLQRATALLAEYRVPVLVNQNRYSLLDRKIEENGLKAAVTDLQQGLVVFSPLAQGLLTNRYLAGIPADSRIKTDGRFLKAATLSEAHVAILRQLNDFALAAGYSLAELALKWLLQQPAVTSVLIGASKPEQILENVATVTLPDLTAGQLLEIEAILSGWM